MQGTTTISNGLSYREGTLQITFIVRLQYYSATPIMRINCDDWPPRYAENPDNWNFL